MTNKKDNVIMIVQARMGSTRLPGKSMMDLAGAPLITRLLERAKKCNEINTIILATTCKPEDDVIEQSELNQISKYLEDLKMIYWTDIIRQL